MFCLFSEKGSALKVKNLLRYVCPNAKGKYSKLIVIFFRNMNFQILIIDRYIMKFRALNKALVLVKKKKKKKKMYLSFSILFLHKIMGTH